MSETALTGLRVLLAEDNPTNQLVATQMLETLGASVTLAVDGGEALEIVRQEPFDLMLVDIEMPRVSGIEVMRTVRAAEPPLSETPMIALTAYVMREHRAAIDAAGADGVIAKPILSIAQFGADVRRLMARRAPAAAPESPAGGGEAARGPVIDRTVYDALASAIGSAAMGELLDKVRSDLADARARLQRARESADLDEARVVTHILISVAGAIGAAPVRDLAKRINTTAHAAEAAADPASSSATALAELRQLDAEIGRLLAALEAGEARR